MIHVLTDNGERIIEANGESNLAELLINNGILIRRQCGGRGTCKKCTVLCNSKSVLSCRTDVNDGDIIDLRGEKRYEILTDCVEAVTDFSPVSGTKECFCAAVDIGTTTVVVKLYKLPLLECVGTVCEINAQSCYGADVISRMEYANCGGLEELKTLIRTQVQRMLKSFGVECERVIVTGNTAMLHFYTGLSTAKMAVAPFEPTSLFGYNRENEYLPRCISAFVGADTTCAVISSGLLDDKCALIADLGTNGELAYIKDGELKCCSVAAGPAFEGAGISQGVTACDGAINRVYIANSQVFYSTIGNCPPIGICGSGLIDAVACMLDLGELDETGYLDSPFQIGDSGVYITAKDIRAVQLAKSAIRTGIDLIAGDCSEINTLYIAGGFGSGINAKSCERIGLIPHAAVKKIKCVSNAALAGAAMIIKNAALFEKCSEISKKAQTVVLSGNPDFSNRYVENMLFIS